MTESSRKKALEESGLLHSNPESVTAVLFDGTNGFFLADDKVQVKYEMLRAHVVDGVSVTDAAASHGYSRAAFYLTLDAFGQAGVTGLLDERRGRRGPLKLTPEIVTFIDTAGSSMGATEIAEEVADRFGVELHRRTIERTRRR
jgi:phage tail tape-measure protein